MKSKCDITKCHAACCYNVPLEKGYLTAFKKKIVNPVIAKKPFGNEKNYDREKTALGRGNYLVYTDKDPRKNKCPFLRADCRCNIYADRPKICRDYGTKKNVMFLHCKFLQGDEGAPTLDDIQKGIAEVAYFYTDLFRAKSKKG